MDFANLIFPAMILFALTGPLTTVFASKVFPPPPPPRRAPSPGRTAPCTAASRRISALHEGAPTPNRQTMWPAGVHGARISKHDVLGCKQAERVAFSAAARPSYSRTPQ
ncbi:hypothetical protein PpBr36_00047 [Pyricularia pennisetigena]|uniref:hypothetical protein n=1 Tax=Pyricularia pennisetigena TaxID=1578925 RepID=UPI001151DF98|nr:hypothetical protein PpBr36_00047 [Pyricularia pennisetigena]TLS29189.1 hypothetical protein PpBr36_00047 [Pyricularia pennisetigena]